MKGRTLTLMAMAGCVATTGAALADSLPTGYGSGNFLHLEQTGANPRAEVMDLDDDGTYDFVFMEQDTVGAKLTGGCADTDVVPAGVIGLQYSPALPDGVVDTPWETGYLAFQQNPFHAQAQLPDPGGSTWPAQFREYAIAHCNGIKPYGLGLGLLDVEVGSLYATGRCHGEPLGPDLEPSDDEPVEGMGVERVALKMDIMCQALAEPTNSPAQTGPAMPDYELDLEVRDIALHATPAHQQTQCPAEVGFAGTIRTNGAGNVQYVVVDQDGEAGPVRSVAVDTGREVDVAFSIEVDPEAAPAGPPPPGGHVPAAGTGFLNPPADPQGPVTAGTGFGDAPAPAAKHTGFVRIAIVSPKQGMQVSPPANYSVLCKPKVGHGSVAVGGMTGLDTPLPRRGTAFGSAVGGSARAAPAPGRPDRMRQRRIETMANPAGSFPETPDALAKPGKLRIAKGLAAPAPRADRPRRTGPSGAEDGGLEHRMATARSAAAGEAMSPASAEVSLTARRLQRNEPGTLAVTVLNRGAGTHTLSVATTVDGATDMRQVRLPAHARRTLLIMVSPRGPVMNVETQVHVDGERIAHASRRFEVAAKQAGSALAAPAARTLRMAPAGAGNAGASLQQAVRTR